MRTDLQQQLSEQMAPVIWHGRYFTTLCPYHDDQSPSLNVYPDGAVCLSAVCRKRVSLSQLLRKVAPLNRNTTQTESKQRLIRWESIPDLSSLCQESHNYLLANPSQGHYLKQRGLEPCIRWNQLGYWNGWITIPVLSAAGQFQGAVFRATPSMQAATGVRYLTPPGQPRLIYTPNYGINDLDDYVYLVFGIFDALALECLEEPVITSTNIRGLRASDLEHVRKIIIVIPDKGEEDKARDLVSGLDWRGQLKLLPYGPNLKDSADYLQAGYSKKLGKLLSL